MKKIFWYMMALVLVGCAFTACNDDEDQVQPVLLEVVKSDVDFAAAGGSGTIQIKCVEGQVTATADKSWVTITGATPQAVQFAVAESADPLIRTATITIKAGTAVESVSILQQPATMDIESQIIEVDPTGQTPTTITYDTSMASAPVVTIPEDGQWLKVTAEAGKLTFVGDLNYKGERETVVTVEQGWKPVQFTVTQDMVNLVTFEVPEMNDRDAITVECEPTEYMAMTSGNWEVQSPNDWITVTKNETGCTVEVAENNSGAVRTSEVNVLIDGEVLMTYTFKQKIYSYNFFLGQWTMNYNGTSTLKVTFAGKEPGISYYMNGLTYNNVVVSYIDTNDQPMLAFETQYMKYNAEQNHYVYLTMRDDNSSYYWGAGYGANLVYNMNEAAQALVFGDNGVAPSKSDPAMTGFSFNWFSGQPASSSTNLKKYNGRYLKVSSFTR